MGVIGDTGAVTFPVQPAKPEPSKHVKIAAAVLVGLVFLLCAAGIYAFAFRGSSSTAVPQDRSFEARAMCETFVKRKLKAPASARFSGESAVKVSSMEYTAAGSVDAENSFGALLRSTFACDLTYDAASQEWTARSVSVSS